ncbi:hypothetical protein Vadar_012716 [Vaccinium darrowii]|uniref:Uncharacterized protein n=1 Tax=Vaccinium darrowii TaxID=229202 RepID=A0ACB7YD35_9ERIC|nr:hypothetical protein Vadar_012716 [Vaccinium darrowii]
MESSNNSSSLEQTLHDGNLYRQVNAFIVAHLRDNNLNQGLAVEKDEMLRGVSSSPSFDSGVAIPAGYGSIPEPRVVAVDFRQYVYPNYAPTVSVYALLFLKFLKRHKYVKLLESLSKFMKTVLEPVNDIDFHPQNTVMITGAKDHTIKFFDFSKTVAKRAFRVIQVRYSSTGGMYVTASKDGAIRIWDGVTASCVRSILGAHGTTEAISASFTKDQREDPEAQKSADHPDHLDSFDSSVPVLCFVTPVTLLMCV